MRTLKNAPRSTEEVDRTEVRETLGPGPALDFILALARHRAEQDHRNAKLTTTERRNIYGYEDY
jgi:hypothetical protein